MPVEAGTLRIAIGTDGGTVRVRIQPPPAVPAADLVRGKSAEEAAALVPLIFNVCAAAQEAAARSALDLPISEGLERKVRQETIREHALKLLMVWPLLLGVAPDRQAPRWALLALDDTDAAAFLRGALLGPGDDLPTNWGGLLDWMRRGCSVPARTFRAIYNDFDAAWGRTEVEPLSPDRPVDWRTATQDGAPVDNGQAFRFRGRDLLSDVEMACGRGMLWRMTARLIEIDDLLTGAATSPSATGGVARAARGAMMVRARCGDGKVTEFERLSPTDFALAPGGVLETALNTLPVKARVPLDALARLIVESIDPCVATEVEMADA